MLDIGISRKEFSYAFVKCCIFYNGKLFGLHAEIGDNNISFEENVSKTFPSLKLARATQPLVIDH